MDQVQSALRRAADTFGRLDIAFNNAGVEHPGTPAAEITEAEWDRVVDTNLRGVFLCHSISQAFERIVARTGVAKIRLHDVRHTHGTLLIKAGVPVKVVSERLGHGNPTFTIDTYQHVLPGMQAEAARIFES